MTTDGPARRRPGDFAAPITTAVVVGLAATSVGWAAAHPVASSPRPAAMALPAQPSVEEARARHQLDSVQHALQLLRREIDALRAVRLPSPPSAPQGSPNGTVVAPPMPGVNPPPPPPPVAAAAPAPPPTHATTGASGAAH